MKKLMFVLALTLALTLTASAQGLVEWTEYSDNPVFGQWIGDPKAYYPSVLYDPDEFSGHGASAKYKMWYGTSNQQTALATSDDGINWTDQGVVMTDGYHATVEYYSDGFAGANSGDNPSDSTMYYRMWYWDWPTLYSVTAIGYTESPDGVNWYNYQPCQNGTVPIVSGIWPDWNRGSYGPCDVLYNPDASNTGTDWTFHMYYDGTTGGDEAIGLGFSSDGITWTGYDADSDGKADPALKGTYVSGDWDYNYVSRATIIKNADDDYEMWYSGGVYSMNHGIGYATSSDGINWTRDENNPIFHKDDGVDWRDERTYCPAVLKDGNSYKMWFAGKGSAYSIGYATAVPPCVEGAGITAKLKCKSLSVCITPPENYAPEEIVAARTVTVGGVECVVEGESVTDRHRCKTGDCALFEFDTSAVAACLSEETLVGKEICVEATLSDENVTCPACDIIEEYCHHGGMR